MELTLEQRGEAIKVIEDQVLGIGGQARVFAVQGHPEWAAKLYHKPDFKHATKLAVMVANPPEDPMAARGHASIAWPMDLLVDPAGSVLGFLMPRVNGTRPIIDYFNPKTRLRACPAFNYFYLLRTARNLAAALHAIHSRGYVVGDLNDSNVLVTQTALVTLVDTDSFQVEDFQSGECYRCPVGRLEYSAPEVLARVGQGLSYASLNRTPEQDLFALATLIFQLLMEGTHPFAGVYKGAAEVPTCSERILAGHFSYYRKQEAPYEPAPVAPPFELLHPRLQQTFVECFVEGQKQPAARHGAMAWVKLLDDVSREVVYCGANGQHAYWPHLKGCPWCARKARLGGRDPFPVLASAPPPNAVEAPVASEVVSRPSVLAPPTLPTLGSKEAAIAQSKATPQPKTTAKPIVRIVRSRTPGEAIPVGKWLTSLWLRAAGLGRRYNAVAGAALALALCALISFTVVSKPWSIPPSTPAVQALGYRLMHFGSWSLVVTLAILAVVAGYTGRFMASRFRGQGKAASMGAIGLAVATAASTIVLIQLGRHSDVAGVTSSAAVIRHRPRPVIPITGGQNRLSSPTNIVMGPERMSLEMATRYRPWTNSLGMPFVPVPGTAGWFCIWETRVKDYRNYAETNSTLDSSWRAPGFVQEDTHAVVRVSWTEAQAFCRWLTEKEREEGLIKPMYSYRLPKDWEWSVAVGLVENPVDTPAYKDERIRETYPWGHQWPPSYRSANYDSSLGVDTFPRTSPVGSFVANQHGLYDLGGNVSEWCEDEYSPGFGDRVLRGAAWSDANRATLLSSCRFHDSSRDRYNNYGFRCVLSAVRSSRLKGK